MKRIFYLPILLILAGQGLALAANPLIMWHDKPAAPGMNHAYPIGGGRFGGLIYGAPERERVVLNDITLWTGRELSSDNYDEMGSYQMLGELLVDCQLPPGGQKIGSNYRRELDLATALHTVTYQAGGVTCRREAFASHADGVMVLRFAPFSGSIRLQGAHKETARAEGRTLCFSGKLSDGLTYETKLVAVSDGGSLRVVGDALEAGECKTLTLILATGTDYIMDHGKAYRGEPPSADIERRLAAAEAKGYARLRAAHVADYQALFNRLKLDLGATSAERREQTTEERRQAHGKAGGDPDLEELLFQYGRYLMIACSRPGGLPANLQGLWNDSNTPAWHSDYHANINIQMNYWPAEPANLAECHRPLFDLIQSQLPAWRKATASEKRFATPDGKPRGWAVRTSHGIHGDIGWQWDVPANAWYCQHFWLHYAFSGDKAWLKEVAYPVMKETCEFWEVRLKKLPDGKLVVPNGWSPEHGPHEDGVSYCQQIVWDLFNNYVAASQALGLDAGYRARIAGLRDALLGPQVGRWGQLMEWMVDRDDPKDQHRHTSHLFAVYPGQQISPTTTPQWAKAASVSLSARGTSGDSRREWAWAWRTALWARLRDAQKAHEMVTNLLAHNTCLNLFGLHPPMQIDGNFGITAGICEMLLQSHAGEIELLPALPRAWLTGSVKGLRARGGVTVDIDWKAGKVTSYRLMAAAPVPVQVRVNGEVKTVTPSRKR